MNRTLELFESYIKRRLAYIENDILREGMLYALEGGKRIRAKIILAICLDKGFDPKKAFAHALALEMIHAYSLVHDDLPCMDNDDYRRGKLSVHKKFGEANALLIGSALLTNAFLLVNASLDEDSLKVKISKELSFNAGANGMIKGQIIDINEGYVNNLQEVIELFSYKTGALFKAAFNISMYIIKDEKNKFNYNKLGELFGLAFQIQDDLLDSEKSNRSILNYQNSEECKQTLNTIFDEINRILKTINLNNKNLLSLIDIVKEREK